jgi:hypothetical protein
MPSHPGGRQDPPPLPGRRKGGQAACKPGSVPRPANRPDERSFLWDGPCDPPHATNPDGARSRACRSLAGPAPVPIRSCSRRGLPCRSCRQARGALLPHPFTLAVRTPERAEAVCFLWRYPSGRPGRALPAASTPWSPDFPPEGHEVPPAIARLPDRTPSYRTEPGRDSCAKMSPERRDTPRSGLRGPGGGIAPH